MSHHHSPLRPTSPIRYLWAAFLTLLFGGIPGWSHNLDMQLNQLSFDKTTREMMQARAEAGQPLLQAGDTVGVVLKATPYRGTKTGAGGYSTFYVPVGSQVVGADYGVLQDSGVFKPLPMKGQSILMHGNGPVDTQVPQELREYVIGPNVLGVSSKMAEAKGFAWGTLAGLYGDTGIFFSTDPATAWQSWADSGGIDKNPATSDNVIRNNKGDYIIPTTLWDAYQMFGFGIKSPGSPVIDPDGRGSTPWGTGTAVAGPESGYAWSFNKAYWDANPTNPNRMRNSIQVGPWKRIKYPGSEITKDTPGRRGTELDLVGVDGSEHGVALSPLNPLPPTVSWSDSTSPKALRLSWGALELYRPEYCRIQLKILKNPGEPGAPFDSDGYLQLYGDAFGGDAGGEYGNKDHLWRYYNPSTGSLGSASMIEVTASKKYVLPNELFHFDIRVVNAGSLPLTNVILENPLPAGLAFVSATPAQSSGPAPLLWNLGTLPPQSIRSVRVNVRAVTTGLITNTASIRSAEHPQPREASDTVTSDSIAIMSGEGTVSPGASQPGGKVIYKIVVRNDGSGLNRAPWKVRDFLPEGFRYTRMVDQFINSARTSTAVISPSAANPNRPEFNITRSLEPGKTLEILFEAELSSTQGPGKYWNRYAVDYDEKVYATGPLAPVTVDGARVGDLVFQDWNANGIQDGSEPGLANVALELWTDPNGDGDPADGVLHRSTSTDSKGAYGFGATMPGKYVVKIAGGVPAGYQLTADPEGPLNGLAKFNLTDTTDQLWIDFGFKPMGTLAVSGLVYSDMINDGVFDPVKDTPIDNVSVSILFDANGNGVDDTGDIPVASTVTASGGAYSFPDLAANLNYVVKVNAASPALPLFFEPNAFKPSSNTVIAVGNLNANRSDQNFGFFANLPGSIGDMVFQDLNRNGVFDSGDLPLPNITVKLYRDDNNNKAPDAGELVRQMSTSGSGRYLFSDLGEGNYVVEVDLADPDLPNGLALSPPHLAATVLPSENRLDIDFPLKRVLNLTVSPTGSAAPGSRLTYTLQANYPQISQFGNVTVSNALPAGTTLTPGSISSGGVFGSSTVSWNLGSTTTSALNTHIPVINCVRNTRLEEPSTVEDTYINAASVNSNYGEQSTMRFRPASTSNRRFGLIRFNVSEIPAGATIRSVSIGLRVAATRTNQTITAYPMNTDWVESVATWSDPNGPAPGRWGAGGSNFDIADYISAQPLGSITPNSLGYKVISSANLVSLVQSWINNPASNKGIGLIVAGSDTGESQIFSSESSVNNVPYMDIQYEFIAPDACGVDSRGVAYWSRSGLLNGKYAKWNGGNFEDALLSPPLAADFKFIAGASSSKRDEKIIGGILGQAENNVVGQIWNGTGWANLPINPLGKASNTNEMGFAVQYEEASGDAIMVWADAYRPNGQQLRFSVWNGTSWTAPASITSYTGSEPSNMKMAVKPGGDEMILVVNDSSYNDHVLVWNGSSWGNSLLLETAPADSSNIHDIAVAYESVSGRGMVLYGRHGEKNVYYRIWNGSSWAAEQSISMPNNNIGVTRYITAASDPGGNQIAVGVLSVGRHGWFSIWDGDAWSTPYVAEYQLHTQDAPTVAVAFESQSGDLLVAYSEKNSNTARFRTWSQSAGWSAEGSAIPLGSDANSMILQADLNTNEIMLVVQDDNLDLVVTRWTGERWKGYRELEDNTGENTRQPFIYLWDYYLRNPNPPLTTAMAQAGPASIVNNSQIITVSTTLTASRNVENILPSDPSFVVLSGSGLSATKLSGPNLGLSTIGQRGLTFSWTYRINGGTAPARGLFRWNQFTVADATFPATDSNSFIYAPNMSFQVDITAPPPNPTIQNQASIALGSQPVTSNRVVTALTESIGDRAWADYNLNGVQDAGEPGISGVRVFLDANNNGLFDSGERNAVTAPDGFYLISSVGTGTHRVLVDVMTVPEGFVASTATAFTRTLAASQSALDCDFGFAPSPLAGSGVSISGLVWLDANQNGALDELENGYSGVVVKLFRDTNSNGSLDGPDYLVDSMFSDSEGQFAFFGLYAGAYLVTTEAPAGSGTVLVSGHSPLTGVIPMSMTAGQERTDAFFGYNYTASIGDFVFYDHNGNGVFNPNGVDNLPGTNDDETGVADATVQLIVDSNGDGKAGAYEPVYAITSTNASGFYLFRNLPPGRYVAKVEDQSVAAPPSSDNAGLVGFMLSTSGEQVPVNLAPGQAFLAADYGFIEKAVIEGYVFHDEDSSSLRDPSESGIAAVAVRVAGTDYKSNPVDLTVDTDSTGRYFFLVPPGSYTLSYNTSDPDIPTGLVRATTPVSYALQIAPGTELADLDFGRDHDGTLGGRIFNDANGNGAQNQGEDGIPDVTVQLFNTPGTTLLATTTTNDRGDYRFTGLPNGTFTVVVYTESLPPDYGTTPTADPDGVMDSRTKPVVNASTPNLAQDFGYRHLGATQTLSGLIFDDNGAGGGVFDNGVRDGAEPGLPSVDLRMDIDLNKDGVYDEYRIITTSPTGTFVSNGVPFSANVELYVLNRTLPRRAFTPSADPNGPVDGRASFANVTSSISGLVYGFALKPGSITGTVVLGNGNGLADPGEPPLANVDIRLTYAGWDDVIGTADDQTILRTSNAAGQYTAGDLDPGVYQIVQTVPYGYKARADADGGHPSNISLNLKPGVDSTRQDFEDYQLPQIRGRVLADADRNGDISVDDTPVAGVTVRLFSDVNGNGLKDAEDVELNTAITDASGVYRFGPILDPARFLVRHDVPNTMISVTDGDGPANGINHIAVAVEELDVADCDFLNRPIPMTLGGRVFDDYNSNALLNAGEAGLSGIQVRLFDAATSMQIGTFTTPADGQYRFTGLWPGNYYVQITPPASHPATGGIPVAMDNDQPGDNNGLQPGGPGTTISSPLIALAVNTESTADGDTDPNTNLTVDIGLFTGITLGDLVWNDSNNNGLKDTSETGLNGISVQLWNPGSDNAFGGTGSAADTLVTTTTTAGGGLYSFRIYTPGRYYIRLTPPSTHPLASTNAVSSDNGVDNDSNGIQLGSAGNDLISPVILLTAGGEPGSSGNTNTENTLDIGLRPCPAITISPTTVATGSVYGSYTQALAATGGVAPRTFRISSGALPNGLSLSTGGVISGTIMAPPGNYWFRVEARDNQGCLGTRDYTMTVTCPSAIISPSGSTLPEAWHWQNYSQAFSASGVATTYTWSRSSGSFPAGLTLDSATGVLSGNVTGAPGTYSFTIRASDAMGFCITDKAYTLEVRARWDFGDANDTLPGTGYFGGATADHRTRLADDGPRHSIRPGFNLGSQIDEEADGQPNSLATGDGSDEDGLVLPAVFVAGSSSTVTVAVTNTIGVTARANLWIDWNGNGSFEDSGERWVNNSTVNGSRSYTVNVPIGAVLNRPIGVRLRLTSYSITSSTGSATDGEVEDYLVTVVCPVLSITTPSLSPWYLGAPMSQTFTAAGGTAPYAWTLASGTLPPGLTLSSAGTLSGTPAVVGSYTFTLRATDAYGCSVTREYTSTVKGMTLGNLVFNDQNDDGIRNPAEPGVPNVTLELWRPGADGAIGGTGANADILHAVTLSDASGAYVFNDLPVGQFFVKLLPPPGLRVTGGTPVNLDNGVNNDNNGSQPDGPGMPLFSPVVTLTPGLESIADGDLDPDTDLTIDFGIWSGVGIGSTLWGDSNSDGRINPDENGFAGVRVELWRDVDGDTANGAEVYMAQTVTNVSGHYTFLGYPSGRYQVVVPNSNFGAGGPLNSAPFASPVRAYSDDQVDDDSNAIQALGGGTEARSPLITLRAGQEPVGSGSGGVTGEFGRGGSLDDSFPDENADMTVDMGFVAPGNIGVGNLVFVDENDNGRADPGEGVNGVIVQLYAAGDNPLTDPPLLTTTTANGGRYLYSIVWEGTFFIHIPALQFAPGAILHSVFPIPETSAGDDDVGEDSLPASKPWLTGVRSQNFSLSTGNAPTAATGETGTDADSDDAMDEHSDLTIDIGLFRAVGLGNLVFFDANENGRAEPSEGRNGVVVELYKDNQTPGFSTPFRTTVTQNGGLYLFDLIPRGRYRAHIPASQFAPGAPLHRAVSIAEGLAGDDDVGEDGINVADPTLTGITSHLVTLFPGTAPTEEDGESGIDSASDNDMDAAIDLTVDFGFQNPVGIGNLVFVDFNDNGRFDPGEGVGGVVVELYRSNQTPGQDIPIFRQTTSTDGHYFFGSLPSGDYCVHIPYTQFRIGAPLANLAPLAFRPFGDDDAGQDGYTLGTPEVDGVITDVVTLTIGTAPVNSSTESGFRNTDDDLYDANNDLTVDFGFGPPDASHVGVGNLVFHDVNGNNQYDTGEGVAGVTVQLFAAGANPQLASPLATTTTNAAGLYLFANLTEGDYMLHIPASQFAAGGPLHQLYSLPGHGQDNGVDDDLDENGIDSASPELTGISSVPFNLAIGQEPTDSTSEFGEATYLDNLTDSNYDLTFDFGFYQSVGLGNLVFIDANGNGTADAGEGVPAVEVQLYSADSIPGWHAPLATTITDSAGRYLFTNLRPGYYIVHIPSSQFSPGAPLHNKLSLPGTSEGDDNLGEDGLDDPHPEWFGISTAIVALTPGQAPAGAEESGLFGSDDDANDFQIDLTIDFGFAPSMAVGNLVFADSNGDGIFDPAIESGVGGVLVELWHQDKPNFPVATTMTDFGGIYSFRVAPGTYRVRIPASEFQSGAPLAHTQSSVNQFAGQPATAGDDDAGEDGLDDTSPALDGVHTAWFTLTPGGAPTFTSGAETGYLSFSDDEDDANSDLTVDLGFTPLPLAVGNLVFRDSNQDGVYTAGVDEPIASVPLRLFHVGDNPQTATPVAVTVTDANGAYLLKTPAEGHYFIHIPASAFAAGGVLQGATSVPGFGEDDGSDDDLNEDGIDAANPAATGVFSIAFELAYGTEPVTSAQAPGIETGAFADSDSAAETITDLTIDFGFQFTAPGAANSQRQSNSLAMGGGNGSNGDGNGESSGETAGEIYPETYLQWQALHDLGAQSAPGQDADGDGVSNLLEYALGLDPLSGVDQRSAIEFDTAAGFAITYKRPATGRQDARYDLQLLADLAASPAVWQSAGQPVSTLQNADGTVTLRFAAPAGWTQGFARLRVTLDADGNGTPEAQAVSQTGAWLTPSLATGMQTLGQPLLKRALYAGPVQIAAADRVTVASGAAVASLLESGREYYLEIATGTAAGHRFEVDESASQGATLVLDLAHAGSTLPSLPAAADGARATLRAHWSLAELLPPAQFGAAATADIADRALFYNSASNQFDTRWLQSGSSPAWVTDSAAPGSLPAGSALLVHRRGAPVTLLWTGLVRDHVFQAVLRPGTQLAAAGFPLPHSPDALGLTTASGLVAGSSAAEADRFRLWTGDSQPGTAGYQSFHLMQSAESSFWTDSANPGAQNVSTQQLFPVARGLFLQRLQEAGTVTVSQPAPQAD